MPRSKRDILALSEETTTPPGALTDSQSVAKVKQAMGNNLYQLELSAGKLMLAELSARFRSTVWLRRGSYVIVDTASLADRANKLDGEIVNVVRDEKAWRKMSYWPAEFSAKSSYTDNSNGDGDGPKMPSSDSEYEF